MANQPAPIFDEDGTQLDRKIIWGQKELGEHLGIAAVQVGKLLRRSLLLHADTDDKQPTDFALSEGLAVWTIQQTAEGLKRYARWHGPRTLELLRVALSENPLPHGPKDRSRVQERAPQEIPASLPERVRALEVRIAELERRLLR